LDNVRRTEIGLYSDGDCGIRILRIGVTQAILRKSVKTPSLIHLLKKSASHLETTVLASLRNLDGMLWNCQLCFTFNCLIIWFISFASVGAKNIVFEIYLIQKMFVCDRGLLILADTVLSTFKNAFSSSHLGLEVGLLFWEVLCFELFFSVHTSLISCQVFLELLLCLLNV